MGKYAEDLTILNEIKSRGINRRVFLFLSGNAWGNRGWYESFRTGGQYDLESGRVSWNHQEPTDVQFAWNPWYFPSTDPTWTTVYVDVTTDPAATKEGDL